MSKHFPTAIKQGDKRATENAVLQNYENKYTLCVRTKSRTTNDVKSEGYSNNVKSHSLGTLPQYSD